MRFREILYIVIAPDSATIIRRNEGGMTQPASQDWIIYT